MRASRTTAGGSDRRSQEDYVQLLSIVKRAKRNNPSRPGWAARKRWQGKRTRREGTWPESTYRKKARQWLSNKKEDFFNSFRRLFWLDTGNAPSLRGVSLAHS